MPANVLALLLVGLLGLGIGSLTGALITWTVFQQQQQQAQLGRELAALRAEVEKLSRPRRAWMDEVRLDVRTELLATAQLLKLSVHDGLDALRRLSPGLAEEVIREVMRR